MMVHTYRVCHQVWSFVQWVNLPCWRSNHLYYLQQDNRLPKRSHSERTNPIIELWQKSKYLFPGPFEDVWKPINVEKVVWRPDLIRTWRLYKYLVSYYNMNLIFIIYIEIIITRVIHYLWSQIHYTFTQMENIAVIWISFYKMLDWHNLLTKFP